MVHRSLWLQYFMFWIRLETQEIFINSFHFVGAPQLWSDTRFLLLSCHGHRRFKHIGLLRRWDKNKPARLGLTCKWQWLRKWLSWRSYCRLFTEGSVLENVWRFLHFFISGVWCMRHKCCCDICIKKIMFFRGVWVSDTWIVGTSKAPFVSSENDIRYIFWRTVFEERQGGWKQAHWRVKKHCGWGGGTRFTLVWEGSGRTVWACLMSPKH